MPDVRLVPAGGPEGPADKEDEEARQFILKVKKTIERCLEQRMNKAEMFRVLREEGLSTWIAFAVYKELRQQNKGFFREYYGMHDQKELREKLGRLIRAYRTGRSNASAAVARAPETARTTAAAMETGTTASIEWSGEQALLEKEIASLLDRAGGGHQFAGAALPQRAVPLLGDKQLHDDQPTACQEWLRAITWVEEVAPTPALTRQGLHIDEQSLANGMFQVVTWPQPAAHLLPGQQLRYQQEQAGQQVQPCYLDQATQLLTGQQQLLHYQEQDLPGGQQPHYQQQAVHLPAEQQELMYLQQEQLMANGGFQIQGAPMVLAAGLPISNNVIDPWPLLQDGIGWGREQPDEPLLQRWPCSGADPLPSSTLPGAELHGNQNFHRSNNVGFHERPQ